MCELISAANRRNRRWWAEVWISGTSTKVDEFEMPEGASREQALDQAALMYDAELAAQDARDLADTQRCALE